MERVYIYMPFHFHLYYYTIEREFPDSKPHICSVPISVSPRARGAVDDLFSFPLKPALPVLCSASSSPSLQHFCPFLLHLYRLLSSVYKDAAISAILKNSLCWTPCFPPAITPVPCFPLYAMKLFQGIVLTSISLLLISLKFL